MPSYDYQIASGFDNAGSLVNVENIADSGGNKFFAPTALGTLDANLVPTVGGALSQSGYDVVIWNMVMLTSQYAYWRTTYASGGYYGNVTIRTTTQQYDTYANYNAIMLIPPPSQITRIGNAYQFPITMKIKEAL